ncbi:MAG: hypothetical protein NC485_12215 [Ruminococcus flavefaciens]|nr:hypothetical protein [Ruminococcus flavefaciens]MCM1060083.1 hypothetical protein [Eubacterium sp.]
MKKTYVNKAKLIVEVISDRLTNKITTVSVFDTRTGNYWNKEKIHDRGIEWFMNLSDLKETLNWNLNGDSNKYCFKWGQSSKTETTGYAYIVD